MRSEKLILVSVRGKLQTWVVGTFSSSPLSPPPHISAASPSGHGLVLREMEAMMKKFQQKCRRARDEMDRWDELQSRLISQFVNASSIID